MKNYRVELWLNPKRISKSFFTKKGLLLYLWWLGKRQRIDYFSLAIYHKEKEIGSANNFTW